MLKRTLSVLLAAAMLLVAFSACGGKPETIVVVVTATPEQSVAPAQPAQPAAPAEPAAPAQPAHALTPGEPPAPKQEMNDVDTSKTAADRNALGDSFRLGIYERPFTREGMQYKQDHDLVFLELAEYNDFYYFSLKLFGASQEGMLSAHYGVEFDTDLDSRGDILLWAQGMDHREWTTADVMVLTDSNNDVGGSSPTQADGSGFGNGYDQVLFSAEVLTDPDMAWQRVNPSNHNVIQLAIKKSVIASTKFMWKGWADSGTANPARFDYNDTMSEKNAGSPNRNSEFYPIDYLFQMDSTCWTAFGFNPTGTEVGGCYVLQPTAAPVCRRVCVTPCYTHAGCCLEYRTVCQ